MNDDAAIEGLKRLGLRTYEARVFIGLQKLGHGTASDVSDVADVPRSQVYGAAESLEERGLIETQQSTPTVYRPVSLQQARRQLLDQLAETGAETFDYLESIQGTEEGEERTESIWMINGADSVTARVVDLARGASDRLLYAVDDPELVSDEVRTAFENAVSRGATVVVASAEPAVLDRVRDIEGVIAFEVPADRDIDMQVQTARFLIVDETILLSTRTASQATEPHEQEVAFWTSENAFASVLAELAEAWLEQPFDTPQ